MKYPISKEFFPYTHFTPPIPNAETAGLIGALMKPPGWINRDREVRIISKWIESYDGSNIELLIFDPYGIEEPAPALVLYHGGGFFFGASGHHYRIARRYALELPCKVIFPQYRRAPRFPHPTPCEDCYAALRWTYQNAESLNIDPARIAVSGDSAGGALAAAVCLMSRDRGTDIPLFQHLVYPVTDRRMNTESHRCFTDTPMWNSKLSVKMWQGYIRDYTDDIIYASPMEAESFDSLPPAYVETAEFDCLHDEALSYAEELRRVGIEVCVNETKGTIHGFDAKESAPGSQKAILQRIEYMKQAFYGE